MSQAQEPSIPLASKDPALQRLLTGVRELVQALLREGIFLTRSDMATVIRPATGKPTPPLVFGQLNRVQLSANAQVNLPFISKSNIGVPLHVAKLEGTLTLTLVPTGFQPNSTTKPLVNGAASLAYTALGLKTLMNDGQNWFAT
jgi:hypothetical protein